MFNVKDWLERVNAQRRFRSIDDAELNSPLDPPEKPAKKVLTCLICGLETAIGQQMFKPGDCEHSFCRPCASKYLRDWLTLKCPAFPHCPGLLTWNEASLLIDEEEIGFCSIDGLYPGFQGPLPGVETAVNSVTLQRPGLENNLPPSAEQEPATNTFNCPICADTKTIEDVFSSQSCQHKICRECARDYIRSLIDDQKSMKCPDPECGAEIVLADVQLVGFSEEEYLRLEKMLFDKASIGLVQCPKPDCRGVAEVVPPLTMFVCPIAACHYQMCVLCKMDWHGGSTCEQYAKWLRRNSAADTRFDEYIRRRKIQTCPVGGEVVLKEEGCNHMTCRCGTHFCYLCGKHFTSNRWEIHTSLKNPLKHCRHFDHH